MRHERIEEGRIEGGRPDVPATAPDQPWLVRRVGDLLRIRIVHSVFIVGAIPIVIASVITVAALLLLNRADKASDGALGVATIYRQLVTGMTARDAYVTAAPAERDRRHAAFGASLSAAETGLKRLQALTQGDRNAATIASILRSTHAYVEAMGTLSEAMSRNDVLLADMDKRLALLAQLTDEARRRQHDANVDVVKTLTARDATLRATQGVVDAAQALRNTIVETAVAVPAPPGGAADPFRAARLTNAVDVLTEALEAAGAKRDADLFRRLVPGLRMGSSGPVLQWLDRLLKIDTTAQRALHDEVAELLTYTVEAHETEQATQNIALSTLKIGDRTAAAFRARDSAQIAAIIGESRALEEAIANQPISPLIQTEMLDALDQWREGLATTEKGLARQNAILKSMTETSGGMILNVSSLNTELTANAGGIGATVRRILLVGAGLGILIGTGTALLVARSISKPLRRLEQGMIDRAARPDAGPLPDADRRDELGSMARATNYFLFELGKREGALRGAKERTETALSQLKQTQSELIQAEKLASLGQLVAGVAHEINTPLGVALTTATVMAEEVRSFEEGVRAGRVSREAFDRFVERTSEGARLIHANLERSASLVQSFKQVAVDQASGERRRFDLQAFTDELFVSLGPLVKRGGHRLETECVADLAMDSYPGALAQVLTNLLSNAFVHAFEPGRQGTVTVRIARHGSSAVRIVFSDDGRGIAAENRTRVFDPFFTTGRSTGSTGLGLHIVFNLVTATLGGTIALNGAPGGGTAFTIDLPINAPSVAAPAPGGLHLLTRAPSRSTA